MDEQNTTRVLLVDDHALLRGALKHRLDAEADILVVATAENADAAIPMAVSLSPDVILMDVDMPGLSCFDAVKTLHVRCPQVRVAFLSAYHHDRYLEQAIAVKAWGYILKTEPEDAVIAALRSIAEGVPYFSPEVQERIVLGYRTTRLAKRTSPVCRLSERELEVLRHLARGLSHESIAQTMSLSKHTVHRHSVSIRRKLAIHDRVELARYAIREGLTEL